MSDDKKKVGKQDDIRINIHEPYELRDWSTKFKVTPGELKEAVRIAGPMVTDVKKQLGIK